MAEASLLLRESLEITRNIHNYIQAILAIPALALYHAARGSKEMAVELYALAAEQPFVANSRWYEDVVGKQIDAIDLPPEVRSAAEERGRARELWQTIEEFLAQLEA